MDHLLALCRLLLTTSVIVNLGAFGESYEVSEYDLDRADYTDMSKFCDCAVSLANRDADRLDLSIGMRQRNIVVIDASTSQEYYCAEGKELKTIPAGPIPDSNDFVVRVKFV